MPKALYAAKYCVCIAGQLHKINYKDIDNIFPYGMCWCNFSDILLIGTNDPNRCRTTRLV